jgi:hypothetical protein
MPEHIILVRMGKLGLSWVLGKIETGNTAREAMTDEWSKQA